MCTEILFKSKNIEVATAGALLDITGCLILNPMYLRDSEINLNYCLCQVDVPKTLEKAGLKFTYNPDTGDFVVE